MHYDPFLLLIILISVVPNVALGVFSNELPTTLRSPWHSGMMIYSRCGQSLLGPSSPLNTEQATYLWIHGQLEGGQRAARNAHRGAGVDMQGSFSQSNSCWGFEGSVAPLWGPKARCRELRNKTPAHSGISFHIPPMYSFHGEGYLSVTVHKDEQNLCVLAQLHTKERKRKE